MSVASGALRPASANWWLPTVSLAWREIIRFLRQRSRVIGAVGQPVIFWILFGAGLHGSFQLSGAGEGISFQEYFLPGVAVMIVLFTSIFASISVIQDRQEGFLQGVLVAPIPRSSIVLGKVLGGTMLSLFQSGLFLAVAPLLQWCGLAPPLTLSPTLFGIVGAILFLTLISVALNALGYFFAWKINSVQGFHGIMSVLLLPMWLMSGAFFPGDASLWVRSLMLLNPLTYGVAGLRHCLAPAVAEGLQLPSLPICWLVLIGFALICLGLDLWLTARDRSQT